MQRRRMLSLAITVLLTVMTLLGTAHISASVYADNGDAAISMGAGALSKGANTSDAQVLIYGGKDWYVINYSADDNQATLFAKEIIDHICFSAEDNDTSNQYGSSDLKTQMDAIANKFTNGEKGAIAARTLAGDNPNQGQDGHDPDRISGPAVEGALLWPLSVAEAESIDPAIKISDPNPDHQFWSQNFWWLRTPGAENYMAALVQGNGSINYVVTNYDSYGIRPAFYLDLPSVLFTSAAADGKSPGTLGADALNEISTNSTNEWKLTVYEADRDFAISKVRPTDDGVSFRYTGAKTGENEYISAIIKDSDDNLKYYGTIAEVSDAEGSGEVIINTAGKIQENDKLYVFNEQLNGDHNTDYASQLIEVIVPGTVSYTVKFNVMNGTWNDGTSEEKSVTLSGYEDDELKLTSDEIPAVGSKPAENYKAGSWDVAPSPDTVITEDTTYTYTYAENPPEPETPSTPSPSPAQKIKNGDKVTVGAGTIKVISAKSKTASFIKAKNQKSINVPATVKVKGQSFKITQIGAKAFTGKKIRTVTIGANVSKIAGKAFYGSKATKMIVKTKKLKKASIKGSLKGSRIKTVQVKIGKNSVNKKYVRKYKKIFTKKNAGRKVKVK